MSSRAELTLTYKVANAQISGFPFPHFFIQDVFPPDYYAQLLAMLPDSEAMLPIGVARNVPNTPDRFVLELKEEHLAALPADKRAFWEELRGWMVGGAFRQMLLHKFGLYIAQRFEGRKDVAYSDEAMLVQDTTRYSLGPHSDATRKVITLLFYLPKDTSQSHLGTSIYLPNDRNFRCPGGPHYKHKDFERLWTLPFLPNSLLVFFKTDRSFHGVEPVADPDTRRWLLLYDIFARKAVSS
jgi:hypothetical protein